MERKPIQIPVKKEPNQVTLLLPEPVIAGSNHEMKANAPIWMVFVLTITEMILGSAIICFLFWMLAGTISVGVILSLCFSLWLWHANSKESKLIISGDYASMEEIDRRYSLLDRIARYQFQLANRQMDLEWQDMLGQAEQQLQEAINDTKVLDAQDESRYWKRKASEYDLHRQKEWDPEEEEAETVEQAVERKFGQWLTTVYADTEPYSDHPWRNKGDWTGEEKEYTKQHIVPVVMSATVPLFEIGQSTGHKALFNFEVYPSLQTAQKFMEDVWDR